MKKVGIISMQRIINYGSFLQAYGLKVTLEEIGCKVVFLDYKYEGSLVADDNKMKIVYKKILRTLKTKNYIKAKKNFKNFKQQINCALNEIGVNENKYQADIECLVIGSDEVFNCLQGYPVGYSKALFGKGFENIPVISYAASFGFTTFNNLREYGIDKEIGQMLSVFKDISVRDDNSELIVKDLIKRKPQKHLDPVLISNYSNAIKEECKLNNFIIVYAYNGRLKEEEEKEIRKIAKKLDKKIVSLGFYQAVADINITCHPLAVFDYFRKADFVITDTFHGTVFSIKMNTPFCTLIRSSNANKLTTLLEQLCLKERAITDIRQVMELFYKKVDFSKPNAILEQERKRSIGYLMDNIIES